MKAKRFLLSFVVALIGIITVNAQDDSGRFFYYDSWAGEVYPAKPEMLLGADGQPVQIVSNTYEAGKGVMEFDRPLVTIGKEAFSCCITFHGDLTIPSTVEKIDEKAFYMCPFTGSLYIPDSVKEIGKLAFFECSHFTGTLRLSNSLTTLGYGAFASTTFTGNITIPSSLTTIEDYAFTGCSSFSSITIESSTPPVINETIFDGCDLGHKTLCLSSCGLAGVYRSANVWKEFGEIAPSHTFANADVQHSYCTSCNHSFLHYSGSDVVTPHHSLLLLGANKLPLTILSNTFQDGKGVMEFDRPLVTIGLSAFEGCENLTRISIPESVEQIEALAFSGCSNLKSVNVRQETPIAVDNSAFQGLSLADLTLIVPCSQTAAYHATNIWKDFGTYQTSHIFAEDDITRAVCTACGHGLFHYNASELIKPSNPTQLLGADGKALTIVSNTFADGDGTIEFDRPVVTIGAKVFRQCQKISGDLVIPYTVTEIGESAFAYCKFGGSLLLPKNLKKLGVGAFCDAKFKGELIIPDGITEIPNEAFYNCGFNDSIQLSKSLKIIGERAFSGCGFTGELVIPDQLESIGKSAFAQCNKITGTIHLPKSLHYLGDTPFPPNFKKMIIDWVDPKVVTCEFNTFEGDYSKKSLWVPCTAISVYKKTEGWKNFSAIEGHHHFADGDDSRGYCRDCNHSFIYYVANGEINRIGKVLGADGKELKQRNWLYEDGHGTLEFEGEMISVSGNLLSQGYTCYGVTLPNSIVTIGEHAFDGFAILGTINMPKSLKTIGDYAFRNCAAFNACNLSIPEGIDTIGNHAFETCRLSSLKIPNTVTFIGDSAFCDCEMLAGSLTIPSSVTYLGEAAFAGCYALSGELVMYNSLTEIKPRTFRRCGFKKSFVIPSSITKIDTEAFLGCGFTGELTLPNTLTYIGDGAFKECTGLTGNLTIPNSINYLGGLAFAKCTGMTGTLTLPNSITEIKSETFRDCGFSTTLVIPNSITKIGWGAFYRVGFTGSLNLPNSITEIGDNAFLEGKFTGSLTIPNSVKTIGKCAFQDCAGFTGTLTLANSITAIGDNAFRGCSGIDTVAACWDTPVAINTSVFTDNNTLKSMTLSLPDCGYRGHYEIAGGWNNFGTITPEHVYADETQSCCTACDHGFFHYEADAPVNPYQGLAIRDKDDKWVTIIKNECNDGIGVLEVSKPIVALHAYAFYGSDFKKVIIPNTVENVGEISFYYSTQLNEVTLPSSVTNVGGQAFNNTSVTKVNINCGAVVAQDFSNESNFNVRFGTAVKEINFGEDVTRIGANLCYAFPNLEKITFSEGLTEIGESAFQNVKSLKMLTVPNSVELIDDNAFNGCSNLRLVTIGDGLKVMGTAAFMGCDALNTLQVGAEVPPTCKGDIVTDNGYNTVTLEVPNNSYATAEVWKKFKNIIVSGDGGGSKVEDLNTNASDVVPVAYYDLNGYQYNEPQPGINIVRYSDGSARKIQIR